MTENQLERKVSKISEWIDRNPNHPKLKIKTQNREYYLQQLVKLDNKAV